MSYKPYFHKDTDSLSQLFTTINDCLIACGKMMLSDDPVYFSKWFDKARTIDSRTTYLFLRNSWDKISDENRALCKSFVMKMDLKKIESIRKIADNPEAADRGFDYRQAIISSKISK